MFEVQNASKKTESWQELAKIQKRIPSTISEWDAVTDIAKKHGLCEAETLDMRVALSRWVDGNRAASKASVGFSGTVTSRHTFDVLDRLPSLSLNDYNGVIALRAPLGSGKTQKVGASFVQAVSGNLGRVAVITHLRSLVAELATRLKAAHYREVTEAELLAETTLAITSASLSNPKFSEFFGSCFYLFIDEFSQVRRFFASKDCGRNPEAAMAALRRHIAAAKCVIVTDADLSDEDIRFLETCRAEGEKIRIIEARPQAISLSLDFLIGEEGIPYILGRAEHEIAGGGAVWIACESSERTMTFGAYLTSQGYKVLAVTSENKDEPEQAAFLKNPDQISRQYQAVIASPVVSCGVSVEHRDGHHFTAVYYVGGGRAVLPSDARQSIRRVRYVHHIIACLVNNSEGKPYDSQTGVASFTAQNDREPTSYERFTISIDAETSHGRAAFMSRFIWQCEDAGWSVRRIHVPSDPSRKSDVKAIRMAQIDARRDELKHAPHLSADEAEKLRRKSSRSLSDNITLQAHGIRMALNVPEVTDEALDLWDGGYGLTRLMRFSEALGLSYGAMNPDVPLVHQRNSEACVTAYAVMFEGFAVLPGHVWRRSEIETIYQRCKDHALAWSWLGIVPKSVIPDVRANGKLRFPKVPDPNRFITDLLDMMGLSVADAQYRENGNRVKTRRIVSEQFQVMTCAIEQQKRHPVLNMSYTKLAVSGDTLEASGTPDRDIAELMPCLASSPFDPSGISDELAAQRIHPRLLPTAIALANEAWTLARPFMKAGTGFSLERAWLPMATETGMQVYVTLPVPDFMAATGETFYPIEHGAEIVMPFDIDASPRLRARREAIFSPANLRRLRHLPKDQLMALVS